MKQESDDHIARDLQAGATAVEEGRLDEAIAAFNRALKLAPDNPDALFGLGMAQAQCGDFAEALRALERAIDVAPDRPPMLLGLGLLHLNMGNYKEAVPAIGSALQCMSEDVPPDLYLLCAEHYAEAGLFDEARDLLRAAIERHPDCADLHVAVGQAQFDPEHPEDALAAFARAVALDPGWAEAHSALGATLLASEQWPKAVSAFERALAIDPDDASTRAGLSIALAEVGQAKYAVAEAERAVRLEPHEPETLCTAARTYLILGRWADAETLLRRAIDLDPAIPESYIGLVEVAMASGSDRLLREALAGLQNAFPEAAEEIAALCAFASPHGTASEPPQQRLKRLAAEAFGMPEELEDFPVISPPEVSAPTPRRKPPKRRPTAPRDQVYKLRIDLAGIRPPIWRRLLVTADTTLATLHWIIQVAMGWDNDHLHEFEIDGVTYSDPAFGLDDVEDENRTALWQLGLEAGSTFVYRYDFGDNWTHIIRVQNVLPPQERTRCPVCTTGRRAAPVQDCGGVGGYYGILEALEHPDAPQNAERLEWIGGEFDPEAFDIEYVNQRLQFLRPKPEPKKSTRRAPKKKKKRRRRQHR